MFRLKHLLVLTCLLILAGTVWAIYPPPVQDAGKFFSMQATEQANKKIRAIYDKYKKDVVVETISSLTAEQIKQMDEEGKAKYFRRRTQDRAKELGLNGVYILFSKKPQHYQIHMDPETQKRMFTVADRKILGEKIVAQFREERFDAGLLDGLDAIEAAFKANSADKK